MNILEKLDGLESRYEEVSTLITDPNVISDQQRFVKLTKEYKDLEDIMKIRRRYIDCLEAIAEAKDILVNESDPDMKEMAREQLAENEALQPSLEEEVKIEKTPKFQTEIITSSKPSIWRFDYAKKYWKTKISQNLTDSINKNISDSELPKEYKKIIHKPNSKLFTANVKESDNCDFLEKDNRTILTLGKENNKKQKDNEDNISQIYEYFKKIGYNNLSDKMLEIKNLLEMTYEDFIKKFYESEEFNSFKNEETTKFYDEGTKKQEGFTISEDLGLIKIFRRKGKREQNI